jgi:hypothetical protein
MSRKKISGGADYIIPLAVVLGGLYLWSKISGFLSEGSASNPSNVPGMANLTAQGTANASADTNIETYASSASFTTGQSWSTSYLYNQNADTATIDQTGAQALWSAIQNQISFWPWGCNDFGPVLTAFQASAQNQTDISFVATFVPGGGDLLTYLRANFEVPCSDGDGAQNPVNLWAFINWANGLSVS